MDRLSALKRSEGYFDDGGFFADLARRVAHRTESEEPSSGPLLRAYLSDEIAPTLADIGFDCEILENDAHPAPFLIAERQEGASLPTVLSYGHGDVVRGMAGHWDAGLDPWTLTDRDGRWYGRGTADNKGQHSINIAAMRTVLETRGRLGFNAKFLIECGEEAGSPGLARFCETHKDRLAADVFIASDGPRLRPDAPTVFMGSRGTLNFDLTLSLRDGAHHSGNWGGLLANPGTILANAIASICDAKGRIQVPEWRPPPIPEPVRAAVAELSPGAGDGGPAIDPDWGEPGLSSMEKVLCWNTFEVLAFTTGNPDAPANAIPPSARAHCHLRYVVPSKTEDFLPALRRFLDARGFDAIRIEPAGKAMNATRLDPDHPWAAWAIKSLQRSAGRDVAVLPNLGGSLPNDNFAETLGLPTIWVPHSYTGCSQHAVNEHVLPDVCREALRLMTGLWWDLGAGDTPFQSAEI